MGVMRSNFLTTDISQAALFILFRNLFMCVFGSLTRRLLQWSNFDDIKTCTAVHNASGVRYFFILLSWYSW